MTGGNSSSSKNLNPAAELTSETLSDYFTAPLIDGAFGQEQLRQHLLQMSLHFARIQSVWGFGFWEWDKACDRFQVLPSNLWRSMGYEPKQLLAINSVEEVLRFVHHQDRAELIKAFRNDPAKLIDGYVHSFRALNSDGSYRWIQVRVNALTDDGGNVSYIAGVNYDITNEKQAEHELRDNQSHFSRVIHSTNDGMWEWSRETGKASFTQGCWRLLGFDIDDNDMGEDRYQAWQERIHPADANRCASLLQDHLHHGGDFDLEYRIRNAQDEWQWVRTRGDVIYDEDGEVEFLAGAHIDITELKKAEDRMLETKRIAEQANQAKSEFLSSMSHELRTPMNAILGFTQLFDFAENLTDEQRENISEIRKAGDQLLVLINDVLELSRIEAGKLQFSLEPIAVGGVIEAVFEHCSKPASEFGVSLSFEPHHLANTFVRADQNGLQQTIINLICQAVHSNRPGGRVIVSLIDTSSDTLIISVRDTGRGIPEACKQDLFEPFSHPRGELNEASTGIGLAISKKLVELMGGRIEFESEEGVGSCFQIHLPIAPQGAATEIKRIAPEPSEHFLINKQLFAGRKLLYIEDNRANIRLLEQYFAEFDAMQFHVADESVLGLYMARSLQPDLILLDINMPGMDGYEVLAILRSDPSTADIPVVAVSANATNVDIQRALEVGFNDYLTKPVDVEQLTMTVTTELHKRDLIT